MFEEPYKSKRIEEMARELNTNPSGVIETALALLDLCMKHKQEGGEIVFRHPDGK